MPFRPSRAVASAAAFAGVTFALSASFGIDYVILKDGTVLQGKLFKEKANVSDSFGKMMVQVDKTNGLQGIDDGPKTIFFGSIGAQIGESGTDQAFRSDFKRYERFIPAGGTQPLPANMQLKALEFDDDWKTQFKIGTGGGNWQNMKLHLTSLDPHTAFILSASHRWRMCYDTKELGPAACRKLLVTHPELNEKGKPDPIKRIAIAQFFKDAGWPEAATAELNKAKADVPGTWPAAATEQADRLRAAIDRAVTRQRADDAERAFAAGRFVAAKAALDAFAPDKADPKDVTRIATVKSRLDAIGPCYESALGLLNPLVESVSGLGPVWPHVAATGGLAFPVIPKPNRTNDQRTLATAGAAVAGELHADAVTRLDLFVSLAEQTVAERAAGRKPGQSDEQLLALAVSGWLKGKNGATADVAVALRGWAARELMLAYQRTNLANDRTKLVQEFLGSGTAVPFDELAQIVSMLPPPVPVDPAQPGTPIPGPVAGLYAKNTGPVADRAAGIDYVLRLPPEYQPGRSYPLVIVLGPPNVPASELAARLAAEADAHGYVIAAPSWAHAADKNGLYDYNGYAHTVVTDTLRDIYRHVNVDPDRVNLFGFGDGATFALDCAAGHPDLFAGVATFGAFVRFYDFFIYYWSNLQKVPVYCVTGELTGENLKLTYKFFQEMLKAGFPSLLTVYKGRGVELYGAEIGPTFDWFDRRVRPTTASVVKPLKGVQYNWLSMRKTDNRFYWIGLNEIAKTNLMDKKGVFPAGINPDIRAGNKLVVTTRGVRKFTVYFERDMIDWTKPLIVEVNGNIPPGYKPKILEPDLTVLLEEFLASGDRKRLFLQKLSFGGF
jgi:pimeloyl-ACP methyl ester carboxylesterase